MNKLEQLACGLTPEIIKIGRQEKHIEKLKKQRDHYKTEYTKLVDVLQLAPFIQDRYTAWQKAREERERVKGLDARVKEQELLIKELTKKLGLNDEQTTN
jgi:hypothetical protein